MLSLLPLGVLFVVYVKHRKLKLLPALMVCLGLAVVLIGLFATTRL